MVNMQKYQHQLNSSSRSAIMTSEARWKSFLLLDEYFGV